MIASEKNMIILNTHQLFKLYLIDIINKRQLHHEKYM